MQQCQHGRCKNTEMHVIMLCMRSNEIHTELLIIAQCSNFVDLISISGLSVNGNFYSGTAFIYELAVSALTLGLMDSFLFSSLYSASSSLAVYVNDAVNLELFGTVVL